tara:strand:- start:2189 stop:2374 length:186 start_codon:yes stop_codon:yes gene_type:complete
LRPDALVWKRVVALFLFPVSAYFDKKERLPFPKAFFGQYEPLPGGRPEDRARGAGPSILSE